jgi:hypothetical protein
MVVRKKHREVIENENRKIDRKIERKKLHAKPIILHFNSRLKRGLSVYNMRLPYKNY